MNDTGHIKTGRPRLDDIEGRRQHCEHHGNIEHRRWKTRLNSKGVQQYRWACPKCENEKRLANYHLAKKKA